MADLFDSFMMGGFECATHQRRDGRQIDVIAVTQHDRRAEQDYRLLAEAGVTTVRDGLRWHLIEATPGVYDWSSFLPMVEASLATGTQVIWDLCHWGVPSWLDVFSDEFVPRFAQFARAAAALLHELTSRTPIYCPINEISFWAWVGGDEAHFGPHARQRGPELKRQLVRASLAAIREIRMVDVRARFVQAEPIIHVSPDSESMEDELAAELHTASQFEAWDLMCGSELAEDGVGGSADMLDILGVNYYWNNQWIRGGVRTPPGHPQHVPLHAMLLRIWERYRRPIVVTETGAEAEAAVGWLGYVSAEIRQAQRDGVVVEGICIYPVMDYPGWDDDRHCRCGLIRVAEGWTTRSLRADLAEEVALQSKLQRPTQDRVLAGAR